MLTSQLFVFASILLDFGLSQFSILILKTEPSLVSHVFRAYLAYFLEATIKDPNSNLEKLTRSKKEVYFLTAIIMRKRSWELISCCSFLTFFTRTKIFWFEMIQYTVVSLGDKTYPWNLHYIPNISNLVNKLFKHNFPWRSPPIKKLMKISKISTQFPLRWVCQIQRNGNYVDFLVVFTSFLNV